MILPGNSVLGMMHRKRVKQVIYCVKQQNLVRAQ